MTIKLDDAQINLWKDLKELASYLDKSRSIKLFKKLIGYSDNLGKNKQYPRIIRRKSSEIANNCNGLYIVGKPGRGKTMLMRKFYEEIKNRGKIYFHFNSFMLEIHQNLHKLRSEKNKCKDELIEVIKRIVKNKKILCFDEFQVNDIADAMILERIFLYLFNNNIFVIMTSNNEPSELYKNGLQRELFVKFINNIFLKNIAVVSMEGSKDYRLQYSSNIHKRYFINNRFNRVYIKSVIDHFIPQGSLLKKEIIVWGRSLVVNKCYKNIAIFDFEELFKNNLSAADYKEICKKFDLVFIFKIPIFKKEDKNEAIRFMNFIDEVYEAKVALMILADKKIDCLYENENDKILYSRVLSRLKEIKTDFYWNNSKFIKKYD